MSLVKFLTIVTVLLLSACSGPMQAIIDNTRSLLNHFDDHLNGVALNPKQQYLKASAGGPPELLTLGFIDPHPQGPVEVWYSTSGEVLRIQNGRIIAGVGLYPLEWRNVRLSSQPSWADIPNNGTTIQRERDIMPGYLFNVSDTLTITPIAPPKSSHITQIPAAGLRWYAETPTGNIKLPKNIYAVSIRDGKETVIYSEQCLSEALCINWQRWPATH